MILLGRGMNFLESMILLGTDLNLRYHTWRLVTSPPFENFVLLLIILNTFSLMLKYHDAPLFYVDILSYLNLLFTTLFTIEAILKIFGYGPKVNNILMLSRNDKNSQLDEN